MKNPFPVCSGTKIHPSNGEWQPQSFADCLVELDALKHAAHEDRALLLYRGQADRKWRLDSTFVRTVKAKLLDMAPTEGFAKHLKESGDLNSMLSSLLVLKYGSFVEPSAELHTIGAEHGADPWFELMKRHQQYPDEDMQQLKGTNLLDWSRSSDVALYFANHRRESAGALFVCDASATGKTLQVVPVAEILAKVREQFMTGQPNGSPLLFSPKKQIAYQRAKNQQAVYIAQMELRLDLLEFWRLQEKKMAEEVILVKIVLPQGTQNECTAYLESMNIDDSFVYPD